MRPLIITPDGVAKTVQRIDNKIIVDFGRHRHAYNEKDTISIKESGHARFGGVEVPWFYGSDEDFIVYRVAACHLGIEKNGFDLQYRIDRAYESLCLVEPRPRINPTRRMSDGLYEVA
jgi:hypothetical protein